MFTRLHDWFSYTPLCERETWEVESRQTGAPAAVWVRLL
jgi:hypothetical protein